MHVMITTTSLPITATLLTKTISIWKLTTTTIHVQVGLSRLVRYDYAYIAADHSNTADDANSNKKNDDDGDDYARLAYNV